VPTYEYLCKDNDRVVEVTHKMNERLATWGEVCERAGVNPGKTAAGAKVDKLISAGFVNTGAASTIASCDNGMPCCGGGMCSFD
jgi:predicted nucleic acid-binding Zn ribbon protein